MARLMAYGALVAPRWLWTSRRSTRKTLGHKRVGGGKPTGMGSGWLKGQTAFTEWRDIISPSD
eukprot:5553339-Amphidinium_carterae.1